MKLFFCLVFLIEAAAWASPLSVVTSIHELPSFRQDYVNGVPSSGLEYDLMEKICEQLERKCVWHAIEPGFKVKPVPTILQQLDIGNYDLAIAFMRGTKERMYAAKASAPYIQTRVSIYGYSGSLKGADQNSEGAPVLENQKIKYVVVGDYERTVKEFLYPDDASKYEIVKVDTDDEAIQMVLAGTADATVTSEMKSKYSDALEFYNYYDSIKNEQWGPRIYGANHNVKLVRDVNRAMKVLIEDGTYDDLLKKYNSQGKEPCFQSEDDDATINIVENYEVCSKRSKK